MTPADFETILQGVPCPVCGEPWPKCAHPVPVPAMAQAVREAVEKTLEQRDKDWRETEIPRLAELEAERDVLRAEIERLRGALEDALDIVKHQAHDLYEAMDDCRAALAPPPKGAHDA